MKIIGKQKQLLMSTCSSITFIFLLLPAFYLFFKPPIFFGFEVCVVLYVMENNPAFHGAAPSDEQLAQALSELGVEA